MKKLFLLAASALMVLASCSKTDIVYQNETPQEIGLFSVAKKQTKAAIDGTGFTHVNMDVVAYLSGGEGVTPGVYFNKTVFTEGNSDGKYTAGKYWPIQNSKINFFATAPGTSYDVVETEFNTENGTATVTLHDNQTNQNDLMYAVGRGEKNSNTAPEVGMTFNHALAWVRFNIKGDTKITINSINIYGAKYNGILTVSNSTWKTDGAQITPGISWEDGTGTAGNPDVNTGIEVTKDGDFQLESNYKLYGNGILVRPCDAEKFVINYTVTVGNDIHTYDYTYETAEWGVNTKYTYNISMNLNEIEIKPVVVNWSEPTNPPADITLE